MSRSMQRSARTTPSSCSPEGQGHAGAKSLKVCPRKTASRPRREHGEAPHQPTADPQGGISPRSADPPSNVAFVDPKDGKPTRVGFRRRRPTRRSVSPSEREKHQWLSTAITNRGSKTETAKRLRTPRSRKFGYTNEMQIPRARQDRRQHGRRRSVADSKKVDAGRWRIWR